ncbi:uncharacterized protein LOC131333691 isoform X2 [Rhododendron vialii]|uniref:uncharacterized protein LOC131333691 isoform X2 n=1 Tax=Rhododendron vialii TaxID=182163 RepID=UPI00265EBA9A|nr:uncharacterized protein LOC131333691 isoform X2 [Rhododendron vialii]
MASTPKKRPKPTTNKHHKSPSSPSHTLLIKEPPPNLFPSASEFLRLIAVVAIAASVAFACNYVVSFLNRQPNPFCDSNADFDYSLSDSCEPCPSNGECYEGKLECAHGYRKHGKLCVEDGEINETAKKLIQEDKLWNDLDEFKLKENQGLDGPIYMYAKKRAIEMVGELLETRKNDEGVKEMKCPDLLVEYYKPITCHVQQWIAKHAFILVPLCALLIGSIWLWLKVQRRCYLSTRAGNLYHQVCEILEEHALVARSLNGEGEPWVVASWLRDHLLLPKERKDMTIWQKVEELVQEDSRLDQYPKLVKGESKVVWEWQVEGSLSSSKKRKKAEESKLKLSEGITPSLNQQNYGLKGGDWVNSITISVHAITVFGQNKRHHPYITDKESYEVDRVPCCSQKP